MSAQPAFTLEDIFIHKRFEPKKLNGLRFISDSLYLTQEVSPDQLSSQVVEHELHSDRKRVILDTRILEQVPALKNYRVDAYTKITDRLFLVSLGTEKIYRHSSKASYYLIDLSARKVIAIADGQKIMYPACSPDGSKIAYVLNNDLYYTDIARNKMVRLTNDGQYNHVINGASDWVYEEEFSMTSAFEWSPDSKYIAYLRFDESGVKETGFDIYRGSYPERYTFKYPRAGEENSQVSVRIADVKKKKSWSLPIEAEYFPLMRWRDADALAVVTMPRWQNELVVSIYSPSAKAVDTLYKEEDRRYVELPSLFAFLPDGELLITSEQSGYNHFYMVGKDKQVHQVTKGSFDITEVLRVDMTDSLVFFQAHLPSPDKKSVAVWDMRTERLSYVTDTSGTAKVSMIGGGNFLETFSSTTVRNKVVVKSMKNKTSHVLIHDVRAEDTILGQKIFFDIPLEGYTLNAWKILPPDFDSTCVYPVLFYLYGGPGSQTVKNEWGRSQDQWLRYMAQSGYIVISVDNRGTGGRGAEFKKMTYMKLGQLEVEDQLAAARYIGSLPYVDETRMSIFGWSYGGYMALLSMMQGQKVFKGGISVAPVTDWEFYDTIYSERYLRSPKSNPSGYRNTSPLQQAGKLEGEHLLVHGTADDNVHFQNSIELVKRLTASEKSFRFMAYPNADHGIGGVKNSMHLYRMLTDFLLEMAR